MNSPTKETAMALKKVLIVDPDSRTRTWVAIRLEAMNLKVIEAVSAAEALKVLASQETHLIVTDGSLERGAKVEEFFNKLNREGKPYILFSDFAREEGKCFVPRQDRDQLLEKVVGFFRPEAASPASASSKARHILIIEDSPTLRGILRRALEKGFPEDIVREAEEGRQALSEMSQKKVDLIITDLEMPGMDGKTFLNLLKANPILSKKPILVFSSNINPELEELVSDMPKVRLLPKPASPEKIIREAAILLGDTKAS